LGDEGIKLATVRCTHKTLAMIQNAALYCRCWPGQSWLGYPSRRSAQGRRRRMALT